ncbi:unnamed protein product [Mytilus edulis]|uniref:Uncharacterized protein n=1 Tax=Mytilus edulis TaxID=6550 RepID=A0A8S3R4E6_MYTED|nr:unnamed protein product [Mytilus edulis]
MDIPKIGDIQFQNVHRLGELKDGKELIIIARFTSFNDRERVNRASKLKNKPPISKYQEYPREINDRRKTHSSRKEFQMQRQHDKLLVDGENDLEPSSSSKLLSAQQRKYVDGSGPPSSARQHRPPDRKDTIPGDDDGLDVSKMKPIVIQSMNKAFQDHEKLYDDISKSYQDMLKELHCFKSAFDEDTSGIPELATCVRILVHRCGQTSLEVQRRKYCVQIIFSEQTLMKNSLTDPHQIISSLKHFNFMNKHLKEVLKDSHSIQKSINILLKDKDSMQQQIIKECLPADQGPGVVYNVKENMRTLEQIRKNIDVIKKISEAQLKDVIESSKGFFANAE